MSFVSKKPSISVRIAHEPSTRSPKTNNIAQDFASQSLRIYDEFGNDLTPLPLLVEDKRTQHIDKENFLDPSAVQPSSVQFFGHSFSASMQSSLNLLSDTVSENSEYIAKNDSDLEGIKGVDDEIHVAESIGPNQEIYVTVGETETYWIFDQQPYVMSTEDNLANLQIERNEAYNKLCASRVGNDRYVESGMNTMPIPTIIKTIQTQDIEYADKAVTAAAYDIWDTDQMTLAEDKKTTIDAAFKSEPTERDLSAIPTAIPRSFIERSNLRQLVNGMEDGVKTSSRTNLPENSEQLGPYGMSSKSTSSMDGTSTPINPFDSNDPVLLKLLRDMEKALNLNYYYDKYLVYRRLLLKKYFPESKGIIERTESGGTVALSGSAVNSTARSNIITETGFSSHQSIFVGPSGPIHGMGTEGPGSLYIKSTHKFYTSPSISLLWKFACNLTKGRNVSSMAFNSKNKDIVAVGYGAFEFDNQQAGLVCCWNIKKINFPERVYQLPCGVTAISWSCKNVNLLAVGMFDGVIMIFDARKESIIPIFDTTHANGRHYGPVTKLEWVLRETGRTAGNTESLISLSMDGRVTEWFTLKSPDCTDLMLLKRPKVHSSSHVVKRKNAEALIVRHAIGTALCFNDVDKNLYLVGIEKGQIHKCSCSYSEQYLSSYNGHTSSVYALKYSPFIPEVFLSCSADWTVRLWHEERAESCHTMATHSSAVNDVAWSPNNGAVFVCTNEGNIEIWDLERSLLDPVHIESISPEATLSVVQFVENSEVSKTKPVLL
nr:WD repeat containing protein 78 [Hymenolepis microstoma]